MPWLTRWSGGSGSTKWFTGNQPSAAEFNNIGDDIRTWGDNVDAGGHNLVNVGGITFAGGGGFGPAAVFSIYAGTITGTLDGVNDTFTLSQPVSSVSDVVLNGIMLTPVQHYTTPTSTTVKFIQPYIPQVGADILIKGYL